jgi:hypothetical protein
MCLRLGLIDGNTLFVDGTRMPANASLAQSWTRARGERELRKIERRIAAILAACEAADRREDATDAAVRLPAALADAQALKERMEGVLEELGRGGQTAINTTDRDCRLMKGRHGVLAGYNVQAVVDDQQGLMVHADVVNDQNDVGQLAAQIESANAVVGGRCAVACGDAGYANTQVLKQLAAKNITPIVPSQDQARRRPRGAFDKTRFIYEAGQDQYRCPAGEILRYRKTDHGARQRTYLITHPSICHRCASFGECTRAKQGRAIVRLMDEAAKQQFEAQFATPASQAIYRRRKERVEHPFGHIKWNLGVRSFLLRGLSGVRAEASILGTCFNLRRVITLCGVSRLLQAWGTV